MAEPFTIFDSKQLHDKQPLLWDEEITDTSGNATSIHSVVDAATTMHVEAGDSVVRQTFQRFNYQPGKSQLVMFTLVLGVQETGVIGRAGYFDESNGVFFESTDGTVFVVVRKDGVDNRIEQQDWNIDRVDGNGPSRVVANPTAAQILVIDFEWLGVGTVRFGAYVGGKLVYLHAEHHATIVDSVYMSTPNLPLRYEISSTGPTAELMHICSTIMSEGGVEENGIQFYEDLSAHVNANSTSVWYALLGIRLSADHIGDRIAVRKTSLMATTNDIFRWGLFFNPTVAGAFVYASVNGVEVAQGDQVNNPSVNLLTGGHKIDGGYAKSSTVVNLPTRSKRNLGQAINGDRDEIVLAVNPLTSNMDVLGGLGWEEII